MPLALLHIYVQYPYVLFTRLFRCPSDQRWQVITGTNPEDADHGRGETDDIPKSNPLKRRNVGDEFTDDYDGGDDEGEEERKSSKVMMTNLLMEMRSMMTVILCYMEMTIMTAVVVMILT